MAKHLCFSAQSHWHSNLEGYKEFSLANNCVLKELGATFLSEETCQIYTM